MGFCAGQRLSVSVFLWVRVAANGAILKCTIIDFERSFAVQQVRVWCQG